MLADSTNVFDRNSIKLAVSEFTDFINFTSFDAEDQLLSLNNTEEEKCALERKAEEALNLVVNEFPTLPFTFYFHNVTRECKEI